MVKFQFPFRLAFLAGPLFFCPLQPVSAQVKIPGIDAAKLEPATKARSLIEELNCVACHKSDAVTSSSRKSPRLAAVGGRVNPDYLRAFIADPHGVKPGTGMPDVLGHLGQKEKADVSEAITHYLASLHKGAPFTPVAPDAVAAEEGEALFHSVGCVACHSPRGPEGIELLAETSVPLGDLEKKYAFEGLRDFLARPHSVRPSGRMPDLRLPGHEIDRISHYLLRKTEVPGHLAFTMWGGNVWEGPEGDVKKERAGQVDDFSLESLGKIHHQMAIDYSGFLRVKVAGDYTFHLEFNGGSLAIDGNEIVSETPSNRRGTKKLKGAAKLGAGSHLIELTYYHTGRDPKFSFEMEGPGIPRKAIPPSMLTTSQAEIPEPKALEVDARLAAEGRKHFENFGCAQCHDDIKAERREFPAMAALNPELGCLKGEGKTPQFNLTDDQRKLIGGALKTIETEKLSDRQIVDKTLASLNCIACHEREGLGGIAPERNAYFTGTKEALGDQGRLPPPLTSVGAKLTADWLTQVMIHGGRQREYLNTRMPLFGEANVGHLVEKFPQVDSLEGLKIPKVANIRESKDAGYEMMGTEGFSCIACHDFNGQKSGAGALELVGVTDRLQKNWFHLYMRQPSRFHPTVIMPSYWPGGESIRKEMLGGDTDQQIEALWNYLSDGTRAKPPKGLSRQSNELRVADEAVMCRGRGTVSYRGIGVGYPERISLAFDSEELALRQLWKGEFASINHGSFRPRGTDKIEFPAGIPFHRLKSMDDAWPYKGKTNHLFPQDHGYQYRGYFLDKVKRPTFMYHYGEIAVEDFFEDLLDTGGKAYFRRSMKFSAPSAQEKFFFRVGSGKAIKAAGEEWQIDSLNLRISGGAAGVVRDGDPKELLIPLALPEGETEIQLEYRW